MKFIALLLACVTVMCAFAGCNDTPKPTTPTTPTTPSTPDTPDDKPDEPGIEYIEMYYDDRTLVRELVGYASQSIEIKDQIVTSTSVVSGEKDVDVIKYDTKTGRIVAVGTGTAVLVVGDEEYNVRVSPAPIMLAVIAGSSSGYGSEGNKKQTVQCKGGQVYSTHLLISSEKWDLNWRDKFVGSALGYTAEDRIRGIDIMTDDGATASGENKGIGAAFANEWNRLTGDKVWVLNVAVGGSCINEWQLDSKENWGRFSAEAFNMATTVLKNEVSAGHYVYKTTVLINFSGGNFAYRKVEYDDELLAKWNDGLWNLFVKEAKVDIDGDGEIDGAEIMGYAPSWNPGNTKFGDDLPLAYYRAASKDYPHVYMAADMRRNFLTDEDVVKYFPQIDYITWDGQKLPMPTKISEIFAEDNHMLQVLYNAMGIEAAQSTYYHLYGGAELKGVTVYDISDEGKPVEVGDTIAMKGKERKQFVVVPSPLGISDFEIEVTRNLKLEEPFYITAIAGGTGTITIKRGDTVVRTITVNVD